MNTRAILHTPDGAELEFCVNSGSALSLIDEDVLAKHFPYLVVQSMPGGQSIRVKGIGTGPTINKYVILPLALPTIDGDTVRLQAEVHVSKRLSCGLLIGNNVLKPNRMDIKWAAQEAHGYDVLKIQEKYVRIFSQDIERRRNKRVAVYAATTTPVRAGTGCNIPIKHDPLPPNTSGYLLSPKLVSDPSLDCFATLPNCMVGGEAQPIPFANFG